MTDINHALLERISQLEDTLEKREFEIALLRETGIAVSSELDLDKVLQLVADHARRLINAETVLIPILNRACDEYTYKAGSGANTDEIIGESLPIDFGVCGWVWHNKKAWWKGMLADLSEDERQHWGKRTGGMILVPLIGRLHFLGGIAGIKKLNDSEFCERDVQLLELFAGQVAIAIENAMAMQRIEEARIAAEQYQAELQRLNKQITSVNQELERMALYDPLTGLPNRSLIIDRLRWELTEAKRSRTPMTTLLLDLDRFQDINDTLGHAVGDQLIQSLAERLMHLLAPGQSLGRMGGDEFVFLLPNASLVQAQTLAQQLRNVMKAPFQLGQEEVVVHASIGIAGFPDHSLDDSQLLTLAEAAMYAAKREKSGFQVYNPSHDSPASGRLALLRNLQSALERQSFQLHYQPKMALADGVISGVEALARWPNSAHGFIPPDMFISAMEQAGLINEFTYWVLDTASQQCAAWRNRGWDLKIAINIPVSILYESRFLEHLQELAERDQALDGLVFEITESLFLSDYERFIELLNAIRQFGIRFSIDDFGTGHSSLSRLRLLPVNELKIDRSFVLAMEHNKDDAVIVKSIIDLAHNLSIEVVAEGVENAPVLASLTRLGCDFAQGYHVCKPLPVHDFEAYIESTRQRIPLIRTQARCNLA